MRKTPLPQWLSELLEEGHIAMAHKEIAVRRLQGLPITAEYLDALERKHVAMARQELAQLGYARISPSSRQSR